MSRSKRLDLMGAEPDRFQPWKVLTTREVYVADPWIRVSVQQVRLPNGSVVDDYHQITFPEYAVVFAQTPDGEVVVERQYKHGVGRCSLVSTTSSGLDGSKVVVIERGRHQAPGLELPEAGGSRNVLAWNHKIVNGSPSFQSDNRTRPSSCCVLSPTRRLGQRLSGSGRCSPGGAATIPTRRPQRPWSGTGTHGHLL